MSIYSPKFCSSGASAPILIVEDNEDNLLLLTYILQNIFGYAVLTAKDGRTALTLVQTYRPQIILTDIMLPDFNGIALLKAFRQRPELRQTPIVAVTAWQESGLAERMLSLGFHGFISKPYTLEDIEAVLQRLV